MTRRTIRIPLSAALLLLALVVPAAADEAADKAGVKAASDAYYAALAVLDDGTAMSGVWAQAPYVTMVGPRTKDIVVGWAALKDYWANGNKRFSKRQVSLQGSQMRVNGTVAWELGRETGESTAADGALTKVDWVTTNIFEKQPDGKWLMVSHHVQPGAPAK